MTAKFWVGGTGTWDNATTTHWSLSTGGAGGAAVPVTGDTVTLDAASGGGIVSVSATISGLSLTSIATGAFTGTLDFSSGNPNLTITGSPGFAANGSGTQTINLGSGTFTINNGGGTIADFTNTNLTLNAGTATLLFSSTAPGAQRSFGGGGKTFANVTLGQNGGGNFRFQISGTAIIGTLTVNGPGALYPAGNFTVSTAFVINGAPGANGVLISNAIDGAGNTITLNGTASINYAAIAGTTFTGSPIATNSIDLGRNSGITITNATGGGGVVIGS